MGGGSSFQTDLVCFFSHARVLTLPTTSHFPLSPGEVTWDDPRSASPDDGPDAASYDPFGGDPAGDDGRVNSPDPTSGGDDGDGAGPASPPAGGGGGAEHRESAVERSSFFDDEDDAGPYVYDDDNSTDSGIGALHRWDDGGGGADDRDGGAAEGGDGGDEGDDAFDWSRDVNGDDGPVIKRSLSSSTPKPWHKKDVADGNSNSFIFDD